MPNFSPPRSQHAHDVFRLFLIILVFIPAIEKVDKKADLTDVSIAKGVIRSKWDKNDKAQLIFPINSYMLPLQT